MSKVEVEFRRIYATRKKVYRPGQRAEVDEALARRLEATRPPFAVRVEARQTEARTPKAKDAGTK